jgi:hypothetical protein
LGAGKFPGWCAGKSGLPIFTLGKLLGTLVWVAPLVLAELGDLEHPHALDFVGANEAPVLQLLEHGGHVAVLVREQLRLDPQRAVLQPAIPVSEGPETHE